MVIKNLIDILMRGQDYHGRAHDVETARRLLEPKAAFLAEVAGKAPWLACEPSLARLVADALALRLALDVKTGATTGG